MDIYKQKIKKYKEKLELEPNNIVYREKLNKYEDKLANKINNETITIHQIEQQFNNNSNIVTKSSSIPYDQYNNFLHSNKEKTESIQATINILKRDKKKDIDNKYYCSPWIIIIILILCNWKFLYNLLIK